MTTRIVALALVLGAAFAASPSSAQQAVAEEEPTVLEEQVIGPMPAPEEEELPFGEPTAVPVPVANDGSRDWLRKEPAPALPAANSGAGGGFSFIAVLLVLGLGGAAMYMRFYRRRPGVVRVAETLRVLSSVRVGPKAHLVSVALPNGVMLLGVTETNITDLGWLSEGDDPVDDASEEPDAADVGRNLVRMPRSASVSRFERALDESMTEPSRFRGNPSVAALLTAETEDVVVETKRGPRKRRARPVSAQVDAPTATAPRVEDQIAGLFRRRN